MYEAHVPVQQRPIDPSQMFAHNRTRTTSSNVFPNASAVAPSARLEQPFALGHNHRSPSVNTLSTVSSGMAPPAAYRTSPTNGHVRRSTSSTSGGGSISGPPMQQTSYVALLRRQKATVWSERAQLEDSRIAAQQKAARMRANREIVGNSSAYVGSRSNTGLSAGGKVAAKIRHHGGKGASLGYSADSNYVGIAGVPLRLSATEVEPEDSEDDDMVLAARTNNHRRTGSSGRSSTASGRRNTPLRTSTGAPASSSSGSNVNLLAMQNSTNRRYSPAQTLDSVSSLMDGEIIGGRDDAASGIACSTASGSSAERGDNVPDMGGSAGRMPANSATNAAVTRERSVRIAEDLRRRGSVDERTMTMSTGRLFIANPD